MHGPVSNASHGAHGIPYFDLLVGLTFLVLTWANYFRDDSRNKMSIWINVGISAICGVFIWSGISGLVR
jgi:hypothetical protein